MRATHRARFPDSGEAGSRCFWTRETGRNERQGRTKGMTTAPIIATHWLLPRLASYENANLAAFPQIDTFANRAESRLDRARADLARIDRDGELTPRGKFAKRKAAHGSLLTDLTGLHREDAGPIYKQRDDARGNAPGPVINHS